MEEENKHYSLLEVLQSVQRMFERYWSKPLWVKVELAKINYYPHSGHAYPLLVEKKEGKTVAETRSTVWVSTFKRIKTKFEAVTKKEFSDGIELLLLVEVKFTASHGLALNIIDVDPNYTLGTMERERLETLKKLKEIGLFDKNRQVELPILPKRVAVISVETSKGFHDFVDTINTNKKGYTIEYELFPALLQGDKAVESIRRQLDEVRSRRNEFDVLVIIRGGGGEVGLNCYDDFSLASAVAQFPLPIITGIGHATNLTVVEMVSHVNMITPTALANFILSKFEDFENRIEKAEDRLIQFSDKIIRDKINILQSMVNVFETDVKLLLQKEYYAIDKLETSLKYQGKELIHRSEKGLNDTLSSLRFIPGEIVGKQTLLIEGLEGRLRKSLVNNLSNTERELTLLESKTRLLDPANVLSRGYSISRFNGKVENISKLKVGDIMETETFEFTYKSKIESLNKK